MQREEMQMVTCERCGHDFDLVDGYGYKREKGETQFICPNCVPEWSRVLEGVCGVRIAQKPYWRSLRDRLLLAVRQRRFPQRIETL
jgi:hypothetical protein